MTEYPLFLAMGVTALAVSLVFLLLRKRRSFYEYPDAKDQETSIPISWDPLTSELSARIFNPDDSDFVARESSRQVARWFRTKRSSLALDWVLAIRKHVNLLMQTYRRAARNNPDLNPANELSLGFEFLLFHVTSGIFYLVVWLVGPLKAAAFVRYPLGLAGQLRKMTEDILPRGTPVAVELLDNKPEPNNRTATL